MSDLTALEISRASLSLTNGYVPVPCVGKAPVLKAWQALEPTALEVRRWSRASPAAINTGVLTRTTPALSSISTTPRRRTRSRPSRGRRFEEHGRLPVRFGRASRRAICVSHRRTVRKDQARIR